MFKKSNPTRDAVFTILLLSLFHKMLGDKRPDTSHPAHISLVTPVTKPITPPVPAPHRAVEDPDRERFFTQLDTCQTYLNVIADRLKRLKPDTPPAQRLTKKLAATQVTLDTLRQHGYKQDSPALALLGPLTALSKHVQEHQLTSIAYDLHEHAAQMYELATQKKVPNVTNDPDFDGIIAETHHIIGLIP